VRVLVTGASGFIGQRVCAAFAPDAALVRASRGPGEGVDVGVNWLDAEAVGALVATSKPDVVIHLAGIASTAVARADVANAYAVNVGGAGILASAVQKHAPGAHFIFAGSGLAYGASFFETTAPLTEASLLRPLDVYAATKAAGEVALRPAVEAGLGATVLRFFNVVGPGQSTALALPSFASQIASIEQGRAAPLLRTGRLDESRDFVDVRDAVRAIVAVARDATGGLRVFNVSSGETHRMRAVLERMIAQSDAQIEIQENTGEGRPVIACGAPDAIRAATGWRAEIALDATLADMLAEHRGLARAAG